jgi:hypothetical protein
MSLRVVRSWMPPHAQLENACLTINNVPSASISLLASSVRLVAMRLKSMPTAPARTKNMPPNSLVAAQRVRKHVGVVKKLSPVHGTAAVTQTRSTWPVQKRLAAAGKARFTGRVLSQHRKLMLEHLAMKL